MSKYFSYRGVIQREMDGYNDVVCDMNKDLTDWEKTAALFSAAPDLMEALEYAYKILGDIYDGKKTDAGSALQPCAEAIARAKGNKI